MTFGQSDTVVLKDLTNALLVVNEDGSLDPVSDVGDHNTFGLFVQKTPSRYLRVCSDKEEISLWIDGRFFKSIADECVAFSSESLFAFSGSDTIYFSMHSTESMEGFRFQEIGINASVVDDSSWLRIRTDSIHLNEYNYVSLMLLMGLLGWLIIKFPNRIKYIIDRAFSLKYSSYELADVRVLSPAGLSFGLFLSLLVGFFHVYFSVAADEGSIEDAHITTLVVQWITMSGFAFAFLLAKWLIASILSSLFSFGKSFEYQIFDFINLTLILSLGLALYFVFDFIFLVRIELLYSHEMKIFISIVFPLTILFLILKFVNNYPHRKLLIITYLCATEIIPAIILIGWFYK